MWHIVCLFFLDFGEHNQNTNNGKDPTQFNQHHVLLYIKPFDEMMSNTAK